MTAAINLFHYRVAGNCSASVTLALELIQKTLFEGQNYLNEGIEQCREN